MECPTMNGKKNMTRAYKIHQQAEEMEKAQNKWWEEIMQLASK